MASFRIEWRKSTKKDLRRIPSADVVKIVAEVALLADDPFPTGAIKLSGSEKAYRFRVGDYRVIYEVYSSILVIEVVRVAHRKDVYRK